ncbi:MAG: hypothetical protein JJU30_13955, partial [Alkalimonas sp.]|nr:hypothetical protein [Alkalimonas sp.]
ATASISPWDQKLYSNHQGTVSRPIEFCSTYQLTEPLLLTLRFDCLLTEDEVQLYQRAFALYHPFIIEHFNASLLSNFMKLDKPLCFAVIHRETSFRIGEPVTDCVYLYRPVLAAERFQAVKTQLHNAGISWDPAPELIAPTESEERYSAVFALKVLYMDIVDDFYPIMLHEYFHYQTLPLKELRPWRPMPVGPFYDLWINEYLSSTLQRNVEMSTFKTLVYFIDGPVQNMFDLGGFNESYDFDRTFCQRQLTEHQWLRQWSDNKIQSKNAIKSQSGNMLRYLQSLHQDPHLAPIYAFYEFTSLAEPGLGFNDLIARIPACNPDKVLPVHAFKQRLLDYDLSTLLADNPNDADAFTGFEGLLRTLWLQQWDSRNPFSACEALADDSEVQQTCAALVMDTLFWRQLSLTEASLSGLSLPESAKALQPRLSAWLTDTKLLSSTPLLLANKVDYLLAKDGRFRNSQQQVADTAAGLNVWPGDTVCQLSGEQLVTTLAGQTVPLQRCRLEDGLGVLWRKDGQTEQVIGLPTLVAQQARLIRDKTGMLHSETVPYVFQDGFIVFQQQDHQVRLNLCLDTGSPLSYITRRYRERYQLTPAYLASQLEPETEAGELPRRVVLPILGAQRQVRVLPHDGFMQCDIIVGSDLLELYSAIELGDNTLTLWYENDALIDISE